MRFAPYSHIFNHVRRFICAGTIIAFITHFYALPYAHAEELALPKPGVMVHLSPPFNPAVLKGIKVHPQDPFEFDFILDQGDGQKSSSEIKAEADRLIKYFMASVTVPESDLWVNLSPYEKNRIIPDSFGLTDMGRDLLGEDYLLKQITASIIYPQDDIGQKFWKRVYEEAGKRFKTTNIPVNTFNKVWIVPEKAVVYENAQSATAYVGKSTLKVMLEEDYLSLKKHSVGSNATAHDIGSQIVREVVIPELNKEINEGKNFAQLRQVYNSLILATWYKKKIKDSILAQVYASQNKTKGLNDSRGKNVNQIYQQYCESFKKGVYNFIKEEQDPLTHQSIPRKYFSGGLGLNKIENAIEYDKANLSDLPSVPNPLRVNVNMNPIDSGASATNLIGIKLSASVSLLDVLNKWAKLRQKENPLIVPASWRINEVKMVTAKGDLSKKIGFNTFEMWRWIFSRMLSSTDKILGKDAKWEAHREGQDLIIQVSAIKGITHQQLKESVDRQNQSTNSDNIIDDLLLETRTIGATLQIQTQLNGEVSNLLQDSKLTLSNPYRAANLLPSTIIRITIPVIFEKVSKDRAMSAQMLHWMVEHMNPQLLEELSHAFSKENLKALSDHMYKPASAMTYMIKAIELDLQEKKQNEIEPTRLERINTILSQIQTFREAEEQTRRNIEESVQGIWIRSNGADSSIERKNLEKYLMNLQERTRLMEQALDPENGFMSFYKDEAVEKYNPKEILQAAGIDRFYPIPPQRKEYAYRFAAINDARHFVDALSMLINSGENTLSLKEISYRIESMLFPDYDQWAEKKNNVEISWPEDLSEFHPSGEQNLIAMLFWYMLLPLRNHDGYAHFDIARSGNSIVLEMKGGVTGSQQLDEDVLFVRSKMIFQLAKELKAVATVSEDGVGVKVFLDPKGMAPYERMSSMGMEALNDRLMKIFEGLPTSTRSINEDSLSRDGQVHIQAVKIHLKEGELDFQLLNDNKKPIKSDTLHSGTPPELGMHILFEDDSVYFINGNNIPFESEQKNQILIRLIDFFKDMGFKEVGIVLVPQSVPYFESLSQNLKTKGIDAGVIPYYVNPAFKEFYVKLDNAMEGQGEDWEAILHQVYQGKSPVIEELEGRDQSVLHKELVQLFKGLSTEPQWVTPDSRVNGKVNITDVDIEYLADRLVIHPVNEANRRIKYNPTGWLGEALDTSVVLVFNKDILRRIEGNKIPISVPDKSKFVERVLVFVKKLGIKQFKGKITGGVAAVDFFKKIISSWEERGLIREKGSAKTYPINWMIYGITVNLSDIDLEGLHPDIQTDKMMSITPIKGFIMEAKKGGIDFTPSQVNLEVNSKGGGIAFKMDPALLEKLKSASGFIPVITTIEPLKDMPAFLGLIAASAS